MSAHSDLNARPVYYVQAGFRVPGTTERFHTAGFCTTKEEPWEIGLWADVRELARAVGQLAFEEAMRLVDVIFPPGFYAPTEIKIDV